MSERAIRLDQFLKLHSLVASGGEAKVRIQAGEVAVDGIVETRRGRRLAPGDRVTIGGRELVVEIDGADAESDRDG